jgi:subtilisin-like proprotein convertase family protein
VLVDAVAIEVSLTHEAVGELTMALIPPSGDPVPLTPVSGQTTRYESDITGLSGDGTWTLQIVDSAKGNRGTLDGWTLFVAAEAGGAAAASAPLAADSFFSDLGNSSEEGRGDVLEPETAELLLYDQ